MTLVAVDTLSVYVYRRTGAEVVAEVVFEKLTQNFSSLVCAK